jgi:hypothetical protein
MKNDVENYQSKNFSDGITFVSYLNPTTLILDARTQHIINVDLFMKSGGSDGILTLNSTDTSTNCSLIRKLLTPDVYATACTNGVLYNVQLFNATKGQLLLPVSNLTERPLDVYFEIQQPPTLLPNTTNHSSTTPITPTDSTLSTPSKEDMTPTEEALKPGKSTSIYLPVLLTVGGVLSLAVVLLVACIVCLCKSRRQKAAQQPSVDISAHSSNGANTPNMSVTNSSAISSIDLEMAVNLLSPPCTHT